MCLIVIADMIIISSSRELPLQNPGANFSFGTTVAADRDIRCSGELFGRNIWANDCRSAFSHFPKDAEGDVFYDHQTHEYIYPEFNDSSQESRHRLPMVQAFGSCLVEVGLATGVAREYSSWRIIGLRFQNLIKRCVEDENKRIGGIVNTGWFRGIAIAIGSDPSPTQADVERRVYGSTVT